MCKNPPVKCTNPSVCTPLRIPQQTPTCQFPTLPHSSVSKEIEKGGGADQARQSIPNRSINFTALLQMAYICMCFMYVQHILFSTQVRKICDDQTSSLVGTACMWAVDPNPSDLSHSKTKQEYEETRATVPLSFVTPAAWCLLLSVSQCISGLGSPSRRLQRDWSWSAS